MNQAQRDAQTVLGMSREISDLTAKLAARDATVEDLQRRLDDLVNGVLNSAPECWDGDESAESLAVTFVESLINGTTDKPGHRDECNCWS